MPQHPEPNVQPRRGLPARESFREPRERERPQRKREQLVERLGRRRHDRQMPSFHRAGR